MPYRNEKDAERRRAYQRVYSLRRYHEGKSWVHKFPDKAKAKRRRRTLRQYDLTPEAWDKLFESQDRRCAICKTPTPASFGWSTDHDHSTNKVRAILCSSCNTGLGQFKDNAAFLRAAADYLDFHKTS